MLKLGVAGTDTGVGKTVVAAALLVLLRERGDRVSGMKPIETGVLSGECGADATLLRAAAGGSDPPDDVCPVALTAPLAPLVAARGAGRRIDLEALDRAFARLCRRRAAVVVEGVGGLLTPITWTLANDGLFLRWGLDLVIVAANRLGALNHTLLTVRAASAARLLVRAVVLNDVPPVADRSLAETNHRTLARLLPGMPVLRFPRVPDPTDSRTLADAARASELHLALTPDPAAPGAPAAS